MTNQSNPISRRSFLRSSALAGGGLMISFTWLSAFNRPGITDGADLPEQWSELTGYIKITPDNIIKIINPNPEFGQNVMTSLPMIIAEELDADWKQVVVEMGPHDSVKLGPQFTGGSNSTRMYWKPLREVGAAARHMLLDAAAQTWNVPLEELTTKEGTILHEKSGKSGKYGEFAAKAATLPIPKGVKQKDPTAFTVVRHAYCHDPTSTGIWNEIKELRCGANAENARY
jgi:isoquinoline 1-oxidoreductase subunit beta